jgi:hypothetical protein
MSLGIKTETKFNPRVFACIGAKAYGYEGIVNNKVVKKSKGKGIHFKEDCKEVETVEN